MLTGELMKMGKVMAAGEAPHLTSHLESELSPRRRLAVRPGLSADLSRGAQVWIVRRDVRSLLLSAQLLEHIVQAAESL